MERNHQYADDVQLYLTFRPCNTLACMCKCKQFLWKCRCRCLQVGSDWTSNDRIHLDGHKTSPSNRDWKRHKSDSILSP